MITEKATGANSRQVGGDHYKAADGSEEHWDRVHRLGLDYFQGQITKYVERWKKKNGVEDLKKARHFLDKYIELQEATGGGTPEPQPTPPCYHPDNARILIQTVAGNGWKCDLCGHKESN